MVIAALEDRVVQEKEEGTGRVFSFRSLVSFEIEHYVFSYKSARDAACLVFINDLS